jgi:acyl carrier protein
MSTDAQTIHSDPTVMRPPKGTGADNATADAETEQRVLTIWQEVLQRESIVLTDDFFDLGGTSLDLIRVFSRVNKEFALSLNGSVLEAEATVSRMAACITSAKRTRA